MSSRTPPRMNLNMLCVLGLLTMFVWGAMLQK